MNLIKKSSHAGKILGGVLLAIGASTASSHANLDISDISSGNLSTTFGAAHTSDLNWVQVFNSGGAGNLGDISGLSMYLRNSSSSTAHVTVSIATYNPIANSYSSAIALGTMSIPGMTTQVNPVALADATYMLTGGTDYALEFTSVANMDIPLTTTGNAPTVTSGVTPDASLVGFGIVSSPPPYSGYQMGFEVDFTPVPEPSTYITGALMMMPLGAGLLGKLRKKQSA